VFTEEAADAPFFLTHRFALGDALSSQI